MEILGIAFTTKDIVLLVVGAILGALAGWPIASSRGRHAAHQLHQQTSMLLQAENRRLHQRLGQLQASLDITQADARAFQAEASADIHQLATMVIELLRDRGITVPGEQPSVAALRRAVDQVSSPATITMAAMTGAPTVTVESSQVSPEEHEEQAG